MKILISSDGMHAHYFQRMAWARAFAECGVEVYFWDCKRIPAFDAFDSFEPDVFMGQSYNLDRALLKCIYERPHLKVGLRAGDWGDFEQDQRFNILYATEDELQTLKKLKEETGKPDFVHIHYDQEAVDQTHSKYKQIGIDAKSLIMCADVQEYLKSNYDDSLNCDIGFVGGYWPYKGIIIDNYLTPLCHPIGEYNIKIFGNQPWTGVNQYCGHIQDSKVKDLFASANICPNLSEPHAHEYGFDINERCFKILCSGGFCISDNVSSIKKIFDGNGVVFADSPNEFRAKIDYYLDNKEERLEISRTGREFVLNNHTNFHRVAEILSHFGYIKESSDIIDGWKKAKEHINVQR
tara:strand:+ start:8886 stop:9938 length:1053 start_codon:yes stop_codon:yes gene_type:complete